MPKKNKLGIFLKKKRIEAGLTQLEVANALDYSSSQFVSNWERGHSQPPLKVFSDLCEIMDVNRDELFELVLEVAIDAVTDDLKTKFTGWKS